MDPIQDLLRRLGETQSDPGAQAALTAEFLILGRSEADREPMRAALDAAAVLHWFETELLGRMLEVTREEAQRQLKSLRAHSFVERSAEEKREYYSLQQATRLGWRSKLFRESPERFRMLSARASSCFEKDDSPSGEIERIYHLLSADQDVGSAELERIVRGWSGNQISEDRYALEMTLQELEDSGLLRGKARARSLIAIARSRFTRGISNQLPEIVAAALQQAREFGDKSAEAEGKCLEGDILQAQGGLLAAQEAFNQYLAINRYFAEQDPDNAEYQRGLAIAQSRVGDVLQALGTPEAAQIAFDQYLAISRRQAQLDPGNAAWQRELALANSRIGDVLQAQGKLSEAQRYFEDYLSTSRRLAANHPSNAHYRHDLVVAESRMGEILKDQEKFGASLLAVAAALENTRQLVEQDANSMAWQRDLAKIETQAGGVFLSCGLVEDAKESQNRAVTISQLIAIREPQLQRDVLSALSSFFPPEERYGRFLLKDLTETQITSVVNNIDQLRTSNAASALNRPLKAADLFICYSSKDVEWRTILEPTLLALQRDGFINLWYDRMVGAGKDWDQEIQDRLDRSEIILCLISIDFLVAPYIQDNEIPKALDRHQTGKARVVPLVVRSCNWDQSPLYPLQTATGDKRPLKTWGDIDAACARIELELRNVYRELRGLEKVESPPN
jgi:tetratricopeptide (TPR) repeat protein